MNSRRTFLGMLASLPGLAWLTPASASVQTHAATLVAIPESKELALVKAMLGCDDGKLISIRCDEMKDEQERVSIDINESASFSRLSSGTITTDTNVAVHVSFIRQKGTADTLAEECLRAIPDAVVVLFKRWCVHVPEYGIYRSHSRQTINGHEVPVDGAFRYQQIGGQRKIVRVRCVAPPTVTYENGITYNNQTEELVFKHGVPHFIPLPNDV